MTLETAWFSQICAVFWSNIELYWLAFITLQRCINCVGPFPFTYDQLCRFFLHCIASLEQVKLTFSSLQTNTDSFENSANTD